MGDFHGGVVALFYSHCGFMGGTGGKRKCEKYFAFSHKHFTHLPTMPRRDDGLEPSLHSIYILYIYYIYIYMYDGPLCTICTLLS